MVQFIFVHDSFKEATELAKRGPKLEAFTVSYRRSNERHPTLQAAVTAAGSKTMAALAKERKYFALRRKMRSWNVTDDDLNSTCDGKTVLEWARDHVANSDLATDLERFKLVAELEYRYVSAERYCVSRSCGSFELNVPSARLTLHFTKLCTNFKIFFGTKVTSEPSLSIFPNLKATRLEGCTQTKL